MSNVQRLLTALIAASALCLLPSAAGAALPTVTTGGAHTCAVGDSGVVWCWGANEHGQLGNGNTTPSTTPVAVQGLPGTVSQIAASRYSTCALLTDRSVWCWGGNSQGEIGDGTWDVADVAPRLTPTKVQNITEVSRISGGEQTFCVTGYDQLARCWGGNNYGEIGNPLAGTPSPNAAVVAGLTNVRGVSVGYRHACAVVNDGSARCWGENSQGEVGDGTNALRTSPVQVVGIGSVYFVRAGGTSSCAVIGVGSGACWGSAGSLGDGTGQGSGVARNVALMSNASALGGSSQTNCAINGGQLLICWGGLPGNGSVAAAMVPVAVSGGDSTLAVSSNGFAGHTCFVVRGGAVYCWGASNASGQLGNGATGGGAATPSRVVNLDLVTGAYASTRVSLTRSGRAKLDRRKKKYTQKFVLTAQLPSLVGMADGCRGNVTVTAKFKRKSARGRGKLKPGYFTCVANVSVKFPARTFRGKKVSVRATWPGNSSIKKIATSGGGFKLK
jgi:alpha-tubulin suppressor-like RCC1 family protein